MQISIFWSEKMSKRIKKWLSTGAARNCLKEILVPKDQNKQFFFYLSKLIK